MSLACIVLSRLLEGRALFKLGVLLLIHYLLIPRHVGAYLSQQVLLDAHLEENVANGARWSQIDI